MLNTFLSNIFTSIVTSNDPIIGFLIYRLGLIACISSGHSKGKEYCRIPFLYCILNSFGGGISRDIAVLGTDIWFFTTAARSDTLFVLYGCLIYTLLLDLIKSDKIKALINHVMTIIDACTVGSFVAIGFDKAIALDFSIPTAIFSGYVTACWGGVAANFKRPSANITTSNMFYHFIVFLGSIMYCLHRNCYMLCTLIPVALLIGNINYEAIIMDSYIKFIYSFSKIDLNERICSLRAFFVNAAARATDYFYLKRVARYPRVYLAFHRLRIS